MRLRHATVDLSAIAHNYEQIKKIVPASKIIAMIKSNAYGHGIIPVAKTLEGADAFGVSVIEEALQLRDEGIQQKIVLMTGVFSFDELQSCVEHQIDIVVHQQQHLDLLKQLDDDAEISVWLKMDVGMHRLGFHPSQVTEVFDALNQISAVRKPVMLMSHLPNADQIADDVTPGQIKLFKQFADQLQVPSSLAKSAGVLAWPSSHYDWVRPGIMLYGISPLEGQTGSQHGLIPAMDFTSKVVGVLHLKKGDAVSYGGDWRCPEDMVVATVGVGYSDGYPRHAKSGTPVLINGVQCQLVGRVCMDMLMVDCRSCPDVNIGDVATLWGQDLPVEKIAECAETNPYELVCHVTQRVISFK